MNGGSCGCAGGCGCGPDGPATPAEAFNPPGQDALAHRVGDYGRFLAAMRERLSGPAYPALRALTVRTADDPAIALLDSWAVLGDLLTFYSERIANEGYLRTATEDGSLALLGGLVGHRPRPGVAAETFLAYTLDRDPRSGQEAAVTIPAGSRAQSVPGPGEDPQTFETAQDLPARSAWNGLPVRPSRPYQLTAQQLAQRAQLFAAGTGNNIKPGDQLLFVFSAEQTADRDQRVLLTVPEVAIDRESGTTAIGLPKPALPTLHGIIQTLAAWITPGGDHSPDPWPDGSRIVTDFDDEVLAPLRTDLPVLGTPSDLAERLGQVIDRLREAKEYARDYPEVADWLETLDTELTTLRSQALLLQPPQPAGDGPGAASAGSVVPPPDGDGPGAVTDPAVSGLGPLLAALRTTPPRPPADSRHLARDPGLLYAPGSDAGTQLLAALDPRLRDGLYAAWRTVDLTVPLALRDVQAMRVTATPFGATAPLKPVYDAQGRVIRFDDWPLTGARLIGMRVDYDDLGIAPDRVEFSYVEGGGSLSKSFSLPGDDGTNDFGPGRVELTTTQEGTQRKGAAGPPESGVTAHFLPGLPDRTVFVSSPAPDSRIHVRIGTATPLDYHLAPGDEQTTTQDGYQVTVRRAAAGDPTSVEVVFSSRLEPTSRNVIALDAVYDGIAPGSWAVVDRPRKGVAGQVPGDPTLSRIITRVTGARVLSRADFGITGKITELTLEDPWLDEQDTLLSHVRDATVYARGEALPLAGEPVVDDVAGDRVELAGLYDGLTPGRWIIVTGERTDIPGTAGVAGAELAMIAAVDQSVDPALPGDTVHTTLRLTAALAYRYRRSTVRINGNVVRATQGATRDEPIGSGEAGVPGQAFTLWQAPLTWLAADTPLGARSTLQVRVDGVLWHEVDSLAGRGPKEQVYVTTTTGDGLIRAEFGDGVHGARLPTGRENVRAVYRVGIGRAANVPAGRITQLTTRPLGVSAVTNPLPATGGADPDGPRQARRAIPLAVTALDRLVSVPDYADFTRSRAGIGRADAVRLHDGTRQIVHVTVAGTDDIPLPGDSDVVTSLRAALTEYGDPRLPVEVAVRERVLLVIAADVTTGPGHSWDTVEPRLRAALLARLGYQGRELAQPARLSEVLATAQAVPGVGHLVVTAFTGVPGDLAPDGLERLADQLAAPQPVVTARPARYREERYQVAGAGGETLTEVSGRFGISVAGLLRLNPDITGTRPLEQGRSVVVFRGVRPAQLAVLAADLPDTLILKEATA